MLLMQASLPQYNLGGGNIHDNEQKTWELGADKLLITSVGAGSHNNPVKPRFLPQLEAIDALLSMMGDNEQLVLSLMQAWSEPLDPWHIDGELGTFADVVMFGEPRFSFQRYELRLDADWLSGKTATREDCGVVPGKHLKYAVDREGLKFHRDLARLQELIDPKQVPRLGRLARAAAKDQVKAGHFPKRSRTSGSRRVHHGKQPNEDAREQIAANSTAKTETPRDANHASLDRRRHRASPKPPDNCAVASLPSAQGLACRDFRCNIDHEAHRAIRPRGRR